MSTETPIISPQVVARIEPCLDHFEKNAAVFLLYDNVNTALQQIYCDVQSAHENNSILDSALFKPPEYMLDGPLAKWARSCAHSEEHWQDQFLEAMLIIKNYSIIKSLGRSKIDLELQFLPKQLETGCYVNRVRKALYLMMEDMTHNEWQQLQSKLIAEARHEPYKLLDIPAKVCKSPECFLLYLMTENVLQEKRGKQKMDFLVLRSCLKGMDPHLHHWSEKLKHLEDEFNREHQDNQQDFKPNRFDSTKKTTDLLKFNLDEKEQGTLVIFNLENYNKESQTSSRQLLTKREGTNIDCCRLEETFRLLKFKIYRHNDPSSAQIVDEIEKSLLLFCKEAKEAKTERCFIVAILAHGDEDGVYAMDGLKVTWKTILTILRNSKTMGLPRLLLIQACKGVAQITKSKDCLEVVEDGPTSTNETCASNLADLFELSASVSGFAAYRSLKFGSFFLHSFCRNILLYGREEDIHQLAIKINYELCNKDLETPDGRRVSMTSELRGTPTKSLWLRVPQGKEDEAMGLVKKWDDQAEKVQVHIGGTKQNRKQTTDDTPSSHPEHHLNGSQRTYSDFETKILNDVKAMILKGNPK